MSLAPAEFCRRRAEECHQNAAKARDPDVKADWRTLESSWSILAQYAEADQLTFEDDKIDLDPVAY